MKNLIPVLLITLVLSSCAEKEREKVCFDYVDIAFGDAWNIKMGVHVDSSKVVHVLVKKYGEGKTYYTGKIKDTTFYKVNTLIHEALAMKYNNEIGQIYPDGDISGIVVSANKKTTINTLLFGNYIPTKLDTIITQLRQLANYDLHQIKDTSFTFLAYDLITPKRMPVEFVSPVIKEDVIEK